MSARTMVAGTSTTNRTGASGGELLLEPVPGGDEPPSLRPGGKSPVKAEMDALANVRAEIRNLETGGRPRERGVHHLRHADLAPAPRCRYGFSRSRRP